MKFFRKPALEKTERPDPPAPAACTGTAPAATPGLSPEEAARQWFAERFGADMPEEVARMFRQIAQAEAKRQKAGGQVLNPNEVKRIQDSMRFYKTKLANIAQTLAGLQAQKEWLHKFKGLNATLEKHRQAFFETNKDYNAHLKEIRELERFETFEAVQGNYQRIKAKENILRLVRKGSASHDEELAEALSADKENQKRAETEDKKYREAWHNLRQMQKTLAEGYRLQAALRLHEAGLKELSDYKERIEQAFTTIQKQGEETAEELKRNKEQAARQQQLLQNLESQQRMLERGEAIQARLNFLQSRKERKEQLQAMLERTLRNQHEQDEKLNRLTLSSQGVDAQIDALQSELQVHQKSIVGMNSYDLQQRAMDLKSKKEMLTNAARLWKQIAEGYSRVDEKSQEIMRMRHHNDALKAQIAKLAPETAGLQRQCEELKYAYVLSKSQDVMQLRKDLREGVGCSVCGATHHPYHSDTLQEQSKLIGEIKTDLEQATAELKHKQSLLEGLRKEQAVEEGRIETCHQALETYRQILQDHVAHWEDFAVLDRSFKDCSAHTNFEGRRIMLQQLMEKTGVDAEEARKELDTFNYHQSNINALNKEIALKEQEKNDIAMRLNEADTGCQVVAYRAEQLQQSLSRTDGQFGELFEEIDKMMAIPNWYKVWTENPENLKIHIQQQMERWSGLKKDMAETKNETIRLQTLQETTDRRIQALRKQLDFIGGKMERLSECRDQIREQLYKTFQEGDVEECGKTAFETLCALEGQKEQARRRADETHALAARRQGYNQRMADTTQELEAQISQERSELDVWIRKYNALHSPVQFAELEQTFNGTTDWNALRKEIRTLTLRNMLAEARADEARLALAAHQADALSQGQDKEHRTATLNTEIARLESEQENILVQIAGCQARLESHEAGLRKLSAGPNTPVIS